MEKNAYHRQADKRVGANRVWVLALLLLLLAGSLGLNFLLFQRAVGLYSLGHSIRLDPLGLEYIPAERLRSDSRGRPVAVFLGDSRAESWPNPAETPTLVFVNLGVGGQTTAQILARFDHHVPPVAPDWIILQAGINDLKTLPLFPWRQREIVQSAKDNMERIVQRGRSLGAQVVLTTVFPVGHVPMVRRLFWSGAVDEGIAELNAHLIRLAGPGVHVLDAHALLATDGQPLGRYHADTLHLNAQGYAVLNRALAPLIEGPR